MSKILREINELKKEQQKDNALLESQKKQFEKELLALDTELENKKDINEEKTTIIKRNFGERLIYLFEGDK